MAARDWGKGKEKSGYGYQRRGPWDDGTGLYHDRWENIQTYTWTKISHTKYAQRYIQMNTSKSGKFE